MSPELDKARELLKRFEKLEGDEAGLSCFAQALCLLASVINGSNGDADKEVARNIFHSYRAQLERKARELLDERNTSKPETLEYWSKVMLAVSSARMETDEKFNVTKVKLIKAWLAQNLSPTEFSLLMKSVKEELT